MKKLNQFLTGAKNIERASFLWNMVASTSNSFQSMILLMFISRKENFVDAAIFSIVYAIASMFLYIGKYSIRNFQVSDVRNEYTYGEYKQLRKITVLAMIAVSLGYIAYGCMFKQYTLYKVACFIFMLAVRLVEAVEDVFHGNLQRNQRLDIASKIWAIRTISYIIVFAIVILISDSLLIASAISLIVTIILCVVLNKSVYEIFPKEASVKKENIRKLLKICFPLALSTFIMVYIGNSPKYTVDTVLTSAEQTSFNVIFMPVFVITLLSNYIYNPMINKMANIWAEGKTSEFRRLMVKQILIVIGFTGVVIVGGEIIGIRILEMLYKVSLVDYKINFIFLMISGGALAIYNFLIVVATIIRRQKMLQYISGSFAVALLVGSGLVLAKLGLQQLCVFYAGVLVLMVIVTLLICNMGMKQKQKGKERND